MTRLDGAPPVADRRADLHLQLGPTGRLGSVPLALGVGVITYTGFAQAWVQGPSALGCLLAALVLVPSAPTLAGRLALNGALFIGWTPLLWWFGALAGVDRAGLLMAFVAGVGAGCAARSGLSAETLRRICPTVGPADLLLPFGAVASLVAVQHFAFASTPARALATLLAGADNHVHVGLFIGLRSHGAALNAIASPADGSSWNWTGYPVGFHAVVATLSELMDPDVERGGAAVLSYVHSLAALVVLCILVMTAAVLSPRGLRRRALLAMVAAVCGWSAFLWDPGQKALANGFGNFWFAAAAAATALLLGFARPKRFRVVYGAAIGGLLVAVAHGWLLLIVPAAPAAASLLIDALGWLKRSHPSRRSVVVLVLIALASSLGVLQAFLLARSEKSIGQLVTEPGGLNGTSPFPTFALLAVALVAYPLVRRGLQRPSCRPAVEGDQRPWVLVTAALVGVGLGTTLLVAQLEATGTSSYYFLKYLMGLELILAGTLPAGAAVIFGVLVPAHRSCLVNIGAALAGTAVITQCFGVGRPGASLLLRETDAGTANIRAPYSRAAMADGILQASAHREDLLLTDYLAVGRDGAVQAFYPDGWYHAMDASLTGAVYERLAVMRRPVRSDREAADVAREVLEQNPRLSVVVSPEHIAAIRSSLRNSALASRLTTWRR